MTKDNSQLQEFVDKTFVSDVCLIIEDGRQKAYSAVNNSMIETYWRVG